MQGLLEQVGFRECGHENRKEFIFYKGDEGIQWGMQCLPRLYGKMMKFGEGEEERWQTLWEEELRGCCDEDGMKIEMWANVAWGRK